MIILRQWCFKIHIRNLETSYCVQYRTLQYDSLLQHGVCENFKVFLLDQLLTRIKRFPAPFQRYIFRALPQLNTKRRLIKDPGGSRSVVRRINRIHHDFPSAPLINLNPPTDNQNSVVTYSMEISDFPPPPPRPRVRSRAPRRVMKHVIPPSWERRMLRRKDNYARS